MHLAIEFQRPLPQPFFWLLLVLPALLIKQPTSTLKHLHACLPQYAVGKADTIIYSVHEHISTYEGPPFLLRTKCFPPTMLGKCVKGAMATNSRGTNQTSILDLHIPFTFDKSLQQPLPPPLYAPPQALPTEEASSQTCADPRQPSMYPICFNNLHTKNGMREIGSHNCHFS